MIASNRSLDYITNMRKEITDLDRYLESLRPQQSPVLRVIEENLKADGKWGINIGLMEGLILQWMIQSHKVQRILEIGTQYGYSTQWMVEALPSNGSLVTLEKDITHYEKARQFIKDERVEIIHGDAEKTLDSLASREPFDFVFIDANKKAYPTYLKYAERYVKKGGLIVGDNTLLFGHVVKDKPGDDISEELWKGMREFNASIFSNSNLVPCFLPTPEGLTVAYKK